MMTPTQAAADYAIATRPLMGPDNAGEREAAFLAGAKWAVHPEQTEWVDLVRGDREQRAFMEYCESLMHEPQPQSTQPQTAPAPPC